MDLEMQLKAWKTKLAELPEDDEHAHEREVVEKQINRLKAHLQLSQLAGERSYPATSGTGRNDGFKGQTLARIVKSQAVAAADGITFAEAAQRIYGKTLGQLIVKAADPITTSDAAGHVGPSPSDIIELLRPQSVYDQLSLRAVPAHMPIARVTEGTQGYWVAEGSTITASKWTSERFTLTPLKVGGLVPLTIEAVRDSSPSADRAVMDDLVFALRTIVDSTFVGTSAATTGTPAGILNGVTPVVSSGDDFEAVDADIKGLLDQFPRELRSAVEFVTSPEIALSLATMRNDLGSLTFPTMTATGGTLHGYRVLVTSGCPADRIIALVPQEVYRIHDVGGVELAVSRDATIAGTNLFENGLIGIRALRSVNWALRRPGVVQYMDGVSYGPTPSPTAS